LTTPTNHPTSELWLLRHGATTWGPPGAPHRTTDSGLVPDGLEDEARTLLASVLSPLSFAADLLAAAAGGPSDLRAGGGWPAPPCPVEDLREWDYGDYEASPPPKNSPADPVWMCWSHGCPGCESCGPGGSALQRCDSPWPWPLVPELPGQRVALLPRDTSCGPGGVAGWGLGAAGRGLLSLGHRVRSACSVTTEQRCDPARNAHPAS